jgi:peptidoglycan/LPS O-acetylase OafA/YrhL
MMGSENSGFGVQEAVNRGFNMMIATILGLTALTFGAEIFAEADPVDKVDNILLAAIGVIAVVWYFIGKNWRRRSVLPVTLVGGALAVQILGVFIEKDDQTALGADIPWLFIFVPLLILVLVLSSAHGRMLKDSASPGS